MDVSTQASRGFLNTSDARQEVDPELLCFTRSKEPLSCMTIFDILPKMFLHSPTSRGQNKSLFNQSIWNFKKSQICNHWAHYNVLDCPFSISCIVGFISIDTFNDLIPDILGFSFIFDARGLLRLDTIYAGTVAKDIPISCPTLFHFSMYESETTKTLQDFLMSAKNIPQCPSISSATD